MGSVRFTDVTGECTVCLAESCSRRTLCETIINVTTALHLFQFPKENCTKAVTGGDECEYGRVDGMAYIGVCKFYNKTLSVKLNNGFLFWKVNSNEQINYT